MTIVVLVTQDFVVEAQLSLDYEFASLKISNLEKYFKEFLINLNRVDISFVNAFVLDRHTRRSSYQIDSIFLKDIEKTLNFNQNSLLFQVENITIDEHEDESITIVFVENTFEAQLIANLIKKIEARSRSRSLEINVDDSRSNANVHLYDVAIVAQLQK